MPMQISQVNSVLSHLNTFSLSNTNILNILNNICIIKNKKTTTYEKNNKKQNGNKNDFFTPKYKNTLFWIWYIYNNGYQEYEFTTDNGFRLEEDEKIKIVESMREYKKMLSSYRLKLQDIENNILYEKMSIISLYALSLIKNINLFYIHNKTYFKSKINDDLDYCIINKNDDDTYSIWNNNKKCPLYIFENSLFQITNLHKPLKGISAYKVNELVEICNKLNHTITNENGKRKTKKELYMMIYKDVV